MIVEQTTNVRTCKQNMNMISFQKGNSKFEFLPTGDVYQFLGGDILINQLLGHPVYGSANNIYLRIFNGEEVIVTPLLGIKSNSTFAYDDNKAKWSGEVEGITYNVTFTLSTENVWFWTIDVEGENKVIDVVYAQDIGVANKGATTTNELYMSQYLDHVVLEGEHGYVVSSRQNQTQGGRFPYLQQGSLNKKVVGYSTDAMQFFGKEYKVTQQPAVLTGDLPNENYQFELSYTALQTEKMTLNGKESIVFYGMFKENYETAITTIDFADEVKEAFESSVKVSSDNLQQVEKVALKKAFNGTVVSKSFTEEDVNRYFATRVLEEKEGDNILSFFTPEHAHVVLMEKELLVERPHGHIITSGLRFDEVPTGLITSTTYMYGIFNSQVVVGNTTLNKLLSTPRGLLNVLKNSGQRIYIKLDETFQLLTMPAAYELGMNYSKWYYKLEDDVLVITSYTAKDRADVVLEVVSEQGKAYEFIITNQLVMGGSEFEQPILVEQTDEMLVVRPAEGTFLRSVYPEIHYNMQVTGTSYTVSDDRIFYTDTVSRDGSLMTMALEATSSFKVVMQGRLDAEVTSIPTYTLAEEKEKFVALYATLTRGFNLSLDGKTNDEIEKFNQTFWWYTHNAMVHYAVPHGLEQPGGAAWGTRDVCQGPLEYFLMAEHYELAGKVIEEIFSHQFFENKEWPQWFMFDKYNMQQDDCHGDVVFWPLKSLGDYIRITGDKSILHKEVGYRHFGNNMPTEQKETILDHVKAAIETIEERFLHDTALISYAGGDWDDTLQPANKALKEKLVSAWTVALAYQSIKQLGDVLSTEDVAYAEKLTNMSADIKEAFHTHLIKDEVIAGFAYCENMDEIEYMLHPDDAKTGIQYRLLPMTRSIISELVDEEQMKKNVSLIEEHLTFPDGVRLMNRPAQYRGGVIQFFQRAEQAANVGREIGLNYVHAHIRFIEAMAKIGSSEKAWEGLLTINPINIREQVKNAVIRQSNSYFSSSDGAFMSRYDFQDNFDELRTGERQVKGGWRIYSSGPGIYLNQLVSNVLGLRFTEDAVIIDPVLPAHLNGLRFDFEVDGKAVQFVYHIENENGTVEKVETNGNVVETTSTPNKYRQGGVMIKKDVLKANLDQDNVIHVYVK